MADSQLIQAIFNGQSPTQMRSEGTVYERAKRGAEAFPPMSFLGRAVWPQEAAMKDARRAPFLQEMAAAGQYPPQYTAAQQVGNGTEYGMPLEWYMQKYGPDVNKWPYMPGAGQ